MTRASAAHRVRQAPLSVPLLFAPLFVAIYLLHISLLRLPYYWDEGGYYIPAAWDFFRLGTLIPETTMRNAHPPLPSILLAGWWKLTGFHIFSTRLFMCLVTTAALLAVFRLSQRLVGNAAGLAVTALTAIYPVWFAQTTLAHADMFAAAFALWAITFYADRPGWIVEAATRLSTPANTISAALLFTLSVLSKETAIVLPLALLCYEGWLLIRHRRRPLSIELLPSPRHFPVRDHAIWMIALLFPALPLAGWYAHHRAKTGFMFGNPEFLRYNATANFSLVRTLLSLWHRLTHLTGHMNLYLPVIATFAVLLLPTRETKDGGRAAAFLPRPVVAMLFVLLTAQWFAFSVLGGALLTRYLLPAYPMVLLLCVAVWKSRVRLWPGIAALSLLAFAVGCEVNPIYPFTPEDNLAYRDMIVLHQHAIRELQRRYPGATVLTAWPVAADLQRPELGYTRAPMRTVQIANFSAEEIAKAAANAGAYDTALVFSTKYDPPAGGLNLARKDRSTDTYYYAYHHDLLPAEIATALGGKIAWQEYRKGQWAAVLYFPRGYDVLLVRPHRRLWTIDDTSSL